MKILIFLIAMFFGFNCEKPSPLDVEIYTLENGLTVMLNEDRNETSVFGAVVIDGGGKRDPSDATGIAHYLEHVLFKGTSKMGTTNYAKEKVYLDSIEVLYDELSKKEDKKTRLKIQRHINDLSVKASEYAIPNEFTRLIEGMGGTGLNAGTGYDFIYYFNSFPSAQIEKWVDLYSHRFLDPVFRLFQSELETVYEEKNRAMDNPFRVFNETSRKYFFKNHPYGQQTILGSVEHLKTPSLSKMKEYYNKYYVPNNMHLLIAGDFDKRDVKKLIKAKFGKLKKGADVEQLDIAEDDFSGREVVDLAITPYRVARFGYRTVKPNHEDAVVLDLISNIFSNSSKTGLLNKLNNENKVLGSYATTGLGGTDHGGFGFGFVPKDDTQSFEDGENLILKEIDKVKSGEFSEDLLQSIKLNMSMDHETRMESVDGRTWLIMSTILDNVPWEEIKNYPNKVNSVTKQKVVEVANKYFTDNYLIVRSDKGDNKKVKLEKPPFKPVEPQNSESNSEYADMLNDIEPEKIDPRFVDFKKDVKVEDIGDNTHFYYVKNPVNSIFSMNLQFGQGTIENAALSQSADFISLLGTKNKTFDQYKNELQKIGSKIEVYTNGNYFGFSISGFDKFFNATLDLLNEFMSEMHVRDEDNSKIEKLVESSKLTRDQESKDPSTAGRALRDYVMYGKKSPFLRRSTLKEVQDMTSDFLIVQAKEAMKYEVDIFYTGTINEVAVIDQIKNRLSISDNLKASKSPITMDYKKHTRNKVFLIDDPKAVQSQIYIMGQGRVLDMESRSTSDVFNKYFGSGMASIIFQEIREFRSLAYTAYGAYVNRPDIELPGYFIGYMGTQVDKSMEAISTYMDLFKNMPIKESRISTIKSGLTQSINTRKPGWRSQGAYVSRARKQGYDKDPNILDYNNYDNVNFDDIINFYKNNITKDPIVITILTDKSKINIDKILDYGELIEIKKKNIFN
ncbi:insulinase family protein [bacterium]|nr:insulinase family protein [bacterium]